MGRTHAGRLKTRRTMVILMITHKAPRPIPIEGHDDLFSRYDWWPGAPDNHILRISKSSLADYTFCSQQYFIKRVLGMKEPDNDNMIRGVNVHECLEMFYDAVDIEKAGELDEGQELRRYFKSQFPGPMEIPRNPKEHFMLDEDLHIDRLVEVEAQRFAASDPEHFLPWGNELELSLVFEMDLDGVKQPVHFIGVIDRIFQNPDGSLHLHELKTGAWKDKEYKYESMRKEMAFYVWLLRKSDDSTRITHWGWDHTRGVVGTDTEDAEVFRFVEPVRVRELGLMMGDVQNLIRSHRKHKGDEDGSSFPLIAQARQSRICEPWCRLKDFCPRFTQHWED